MDDKRSDTLKGMNPGTHKSRACGNRSESTDELRGLDKPLSVAYITLGLRVRFGLGLLVESEILKMITYLNVPYEQRHLAKKAGAQWNPARKQWYVQDVDDLSTFTRWMSSHLTEPHKKTAYEITHKAALSKNNQKVIRK